MNHPAPRHLASLAPHRTGAAEGWLMVPRCTRCARWQWPPRHVCGDCGGELTWQRASGRATVVTHTVVRRAGHPALAADVPYVVAVTQLDEGPRLIVTIVDAEPEAVAAGDRVVARFENCDDGATAVCVMAPAVAGGAT